MQFSNYAVLRRSLFEAHLEIGDENSWKRKRNVHGEMQGYDEKERKGREKRKRRDIRVEMQKKKKERNGKKERQKRKERESGYRRQKARVRRNEGKGVE